MGREKHDDVNKQEGDETEKLTEQFPDPANDERLQAARIPLPDPPKGNWSRPISEAAGTKPSKSQTVAEFRGMGIGYSIGLTLVTSILIGTGLGWLVDNYILHSKGTPWGLILGFFAGTITGFVQMIAITNRLNAEEEAAQSRGKDTR